MCTKVQSIILRPCLLKTVRKFSKFVDNKIPEWIPKYDDLPPPPQYLMVDDDDDDDEGIVHQDKNSVANIEHKHNEVVTTERSSATSYLILDQLENNSIYPSSIKYGFVPSLNDVPSEVMTPIEQQTALTAADAANWPIPPWHSPDFIEPKRNETQIIANNISKYPEMFAHTEDIDVYHVSNDPMVSYEEKVTQLNIKQQKIMRQKEIKDYLTKRREPIQVQQLSMFYDDTFRVKVHMIAAIIVIVAYVKYRILPKFGNKYGYEGKDVERNERLSKLPITFREEGGIKHEEDLSHLTTRIDS